MTFEYFTENAGGGVRLAYGRWPRVGNSFRNDPASFRWHSSLESIRIPWCAKKAAPQYIAVKILWMDCCKNTKKDPLWAKISIYKSRDNISRQRRRQWAWRHHWRRCRRGLHLQLKQAASAAVAVVAQHYKYCDNKYLDMYIRYANITHIWGSVQIKYFETPWGRDKSIYQSAKGAAFLEHHGIRTSKYLFFFKALK